MAQFKDLTGQKFNRWLVLKNLGTRETCRYNDKRTNKTRVMTSRFYECQCDCGTISEIIAGNLLSKMSRGCNKCTANLGRGHKFTYSTHPLFTIWNGMMSRCYNAKTSNYHNYGGRGITVCKRWHNFENFVQDMSPRPDGFSIDRVNNNGNYTPENCRWATAKQQSINRRKTTIERGCGANGRPLDDLDYRSDISNERKRQIRQKRKGLCYKCNEPIHRASLCKSHYEIRRK